MSFDKFNEYSEFFFLSPSKKAKISTFHKIREFILNEFDGKLEILILVQM